MPLSNKPTQIGGFAFILVLAYIALGALVSITQTFATPCAFYESNIPTRSSNSLIRLVYGAVMWGPNFYRHAINEDMPIRHFLLASDCQWSERPPRRESVFTRDPSVRNCPTGTLPYKADRCYLPIRVKHDYVDTSPDGTCPEGTFAEGPPFADRCSVFTSAFTSAGRLGLVRPDDARIKAAGPPAGPTIRHEPGDPVESWPAEVVDARCDAGWIRETAFPVRCRLPSLPKPTGGVCPPGFFAWKPGPNDVAEPKVEVCRLKP